MDGQTIVEVHSLAIVLQEAVLKALQKELGHVPDVAWALQSGNLSAIAAAALADVSGKSTGGVDS